MRWFPSFVLALVGCLQSAFSQDRPFDDSIVLSGTMIASSQNYQIQKMSCEIAGIFSQGTLESKNIQLSIIAKSQGAGFHCGHSLDPNSLVLGIKGSMQQYVLEGTIYRSENLKTNSQPYMAFQLAPFFSLGLSQEVQTGEYKTQDGNYSAGSHRLLLSGTWHQDQWEITVLYADRYRDTLVSTIDIPRSLSLAGRYQFSPLVTTALVLSRKDYPGIASNASLEAGSDTKLVLASRITDQLTTELSWTHSRNLEGESQAKSQTLGIMGRYAMNELVKITGFMNQYKGDSRDFDTSMSAYGISISMRR